MPRAQKQEVAGPKSKTCGVEVATIQLHMNASGGRICILHGNLHHEGSDVMYHYLGEHYRKSVSLPSAFIPFRMIES